MKQMRTSRVLLYAAFALTATTAVASGVMAFKKAPLVDRMTQELISAKDSVNSLRTERDLLLCVKSKGGAEAYFAEVGKKNNDLDAEICKLEQLSATVKEARRSFNGYISLLIASGILAFFSGACILAGLAFDRKKSQKHSVEKPTTELEDTLHRRKGENL